MRRWLVAPAMVGTLIGGYGIAAAQTGTPSTTTAASPTTTAAPDSSSSTADSPTTTAAPSPSGATDTPDSGTGDPGRPPRGDETPLTGETADKVKAAAQKAVPDGTVDRVETDAQGSPYEAHLTKADGSHVTVEMNENFEVTSVETDEGRGGRHGPRGNETPLTGETADKVKAAAQKAVPDGTVDRIENDDDGSPYEAHMTKADGSHVTVKVNENFEVTSVENGPMGGPRPPR